MKKFFVFFSAMFAFYVLTSFVVSTKPISEPENDFIYYTSVTAWEDVTESITLHIYYKEGNGVRKYYTSCNDSRSGVCYLYVEKNKLYNSSSCKDFRRNYRYNTAYGTPYYFNCNLPYMIDSTPDE
jgi:hypothetical protein